MNVQSILFRRGTVKNKIFGLFATPCITLDGNILLVKYYEIEKSEIKVVEKLLNVS